MGEPAGIGPDIALQAWERRQLTDIPTFYLLADPYLLKSRSRRLGLEIQFALVEPEEALATFPTALPVVPIAEGIDDKPGEIVTATSTAVVRAIEQSVTDVMGGRAAALVTNPINKKALYDTGFTHAGHTEFLGELALRAGGKPRRPVMLLAGPDLLVVPVTVHIPIKDVAARLTSELIVETARITANDLMSRFGIEAPRLAICGLNPHAGEGGSLGREELEIIAPAIDELRAMGINASGPHPADTLFHPEARKAYDCALAMYHDQALVPIKTIAFDSAVNVTLGLPFVRTSPDHGTAFDIAGTGASRPGSFEAAIRLAAALADPKTVD